MCFFTPNNCIKISRISSQDDQARLEWKFNWVESFRHHTITSRSFAAQAEIFVICILSCKLEWNLRNDKKKNVDAFLSSLSISFRVVIKLQLCALVHGSMSPHVMEQRVISMRRFRKRASTLHLIKFCNLIPLCGPYANVEMPRSNAVNPIRSLFNCHHDDGKQKSFCWMWHMTKQKVEIHSNLKTITVEVQYF